MAENGYHVIRKVTISTGIIQTVAGTGSSGYNADSIQATAATLNNPGDVALDSSGNMYITDHWNYRIRKVTVSTGLITTELSTGINRACSIRFFDNDNYFYVTLCTGNTVVKVSNR